VSTTIGIHNDLATKNAVIDELEWTPDVDAAGIGVAVERGAVTLSGEVDDYAERIAARHAALRVRGVSAVLDSMTVHPKSATPVTEADIAKEVERALLWAVNVPDTVKAEIVGHHVTLVGEVRWDYQRQMAQRVVRNLRGVHSVSNMITLSARPSASDAHERIKNALLRNAQLDANHIAVVVTGTKAILTGHVRSWAEREQAGLAAWSSPHVTDVVNRLVVEDH